MAVDEDCVVGEVGVVVDYVGEIDHCFAALIAGNGEVGG